jgi:preprotein translocase SecE subunit
VAFRIYKSGQGRYVRVGTAIAAGLVTLVLCYYTWGLLSRHVSDDFAYKVYVVYAAPAVLFAAAAVAMAYYLNKPKAADFFIATESEMKKVSWSNKAELVGSTVVVIVTVFLLALFIYAADNVIIITLGRGLNLW